MFYFSLYFHHSFIRIIGTLGLRNVHSLAFKIIAHHSSRMLLFYSFLPFFADKVIFHFVFLSIFFPTFVLMYCTRCFVFSILQRGISLTSKPSILNRSIHSDFHLLYIHNRFNVYHNMINMPSSHRNWFSYRYTQL